MRKIAFTKMEGCGNDYVYLDGVSEDLRLAEGDIPVLARAVSDRHYGVGSDGLVLILPPTSPDNADLRMRMFNADGSEAEMCGNASRCVGRFAWEHALTDRPVIRLETLAGIKLLQRVDDAGGCPSRVCGHGHAGTGPAAHPGLPRHGIGSRKSVYRPAHPGPGS